MVTRDRLEEIVDVYEKLRVTMPTTGPGDGDWERHAQLANLAVQIDIIKALDAIYRRLQAL